MKICILYGSPRKKNTYAAVQQIKARLRLHEEVEFVEYILQKEPHDFCCGCYTCINGAEEKCPHAAHVQPVIQAMRGADGLIFATPVYVMDMTAQMKAFWITRVIFIWYTAPTRRCSKSPPWWFPRRRGPVRRMPMRRSYGR